MGEHTTSAADAASQAGPHGLAVDPQAAIDFLSKIGGRISFARIVPDRSGPPLCVTLDLPEKAASLEKTLNRSGAETWNLYYALNEPRAGTDGKPKETDIAVLRGVVIDLDPDAETEKRPGGFAAERARLLALAQERLEDPTCPATAAVDTGNGVQILWFFVDPIDNSDENRAHVKAQARGLGVRFGGDATHSVDHLFRLPGTVNNPDARKRAKGRAAAPARLIGANWSHRCTLDALAALAPPAEAPRAAPAALGLHYPDILDAALGGVDSLPDELQRWAEKVASAAGFAAAAGNPDRSSRDFALCRICVEVGMTDPTEIGQVAFAHSPEKLLGKEGATGGEAYAAGTIGKAVACLTAPRLRPEDFFTAEVMEAGPGAGQATVASPDRMRGLTLAELLDTEPPEFLVGRHIPQGGLGFVYGQPSAGKSFFALDLALHIAHGLPAWHGDAIAPRHGGRVVYIAGEGQSGFGARCAAWLQGRLIPEGAEPAFRFIGEAVNLTHPQSVDALVARIAGWGWQSVDLIVVDTVSRSMAGADENLQKDMSRWVDACARLQAAFGATILGVHHEGKGGRGEMRGSSVLHGAGDFVLRIVKETNGRGATLSCVKQKDAPDGWSDLYLFRNRSGMLKSRPYASLVIERTTPKKDSASGEERQALGRAALQIVGGAGETKLRPVWQQVRDAMRLAGFDWPADDKRTIERTHDLLAGLPVDVSDGSSGFSVWAERRPARQGGAVGNTSPWVLCVAEGVTTRPDIPEPDEKGAS